MEKSLEILKWVNTAPTLADNGDFRFARLKVVSLLFFPCLFVLTVVNFEE